MRSPSAIFAAVASLAMLTWPGTSLRAQESDRGSADSEEAAASAWVAPNGPLVFFGGNPLARSTFAPDVEGADLIPRGSWRLDAGFGYANVFERIQTRTFDQFFDFERLTTRVGVRWAPAERLEIGGRLRWETSWGGFLDGFIDGFHQLFGFPNADREKFPAGQHLIHIGDFEGPVRFRVPQRDLVLEEGQLFAKWGAWRSERGDRAMSLAGAVRFPLTDQGLRSQRVNFAGQLLGRWSWTRWHLHWLVGGTSIRTGPAMEPVVRSAALLWSGAVERTIGQRWSAIGQLSGSTSYLEDGGNRNFDRPANSLVLGITYRRGSWKWEASFAEDMPPNSPAVDFTAGLRMSRSW